MVPVSGHRDRHDSLVAGRSLEGVRHGEQVPVAAPPAHEPQANGKAVGVRPAGTLTAGRPVEIRQTDATGFRA